MMSCWLLPSRFWLVRNLQDSANVSETNVQKAYQPVRLFLSSKELLLVRIPQRKMKRNVNFLSMLQNELPQREAFKNKGISRIGPSPVGINENKPCLAPAKKTFKQRNSRKVPNQTTSNISLVVSSRVKCNYLDMQRRNMTRTKSVSVIQSCREVR